MNATKTRSDRWTDADHPDTTGQVPSMSTTDEGPEDRPYRSGADPDGQAKPTNPDQETSGPAPAVSYAGSGTTDPIELTTETHGAHYRGPQGDI